jgi:hypothetical protein
VAMPLDLQYGQAPITPRATQTVRFVAASSLLMRETHGGALWPQLLAYSGLGAVTLVWIGVLIIGFASLERSGAASRRQRKAGTRAMRVPALSVSNRA